MMYDGEEMPELEQFSDSDSDGGDEEFSGRALGDPPSNPKSINHTRDFTEQSLTSQSSATFHSTQRMRY